METSKYMQLLHKTEDYIVPYTKNRDYRENSVCYEGVLRKHHYEQDMVILLTSPLSQEDAAFYEFRLSDITHAEDLPNIVTETGENIRMARLWVKKGSTGLLMQTFTVQAEERSPRRGS
ncbi:MAG: hypothetical protein LBC67_00710 [Spirochaetales bacterium]|jgi:hypothetical protein|nr:hypothetical protein [Spirochaetales bacterium]